jgi:hypothetical protein
MCTASFLRHSCVYLWAFSSLAARALSLGVSCMSSMCPVEQGHKTLGGGRVECGSRDAGMWGV